jgi:hypothetical protein
MLVGGQERYLIGFPVMAKRMNRGEPAEPDDPQFYLC